MYEIVHIMCLYFLLRLTLLEAIMDQEKIDTLLKQAYQSHEKGDLLSLMKYVDEILEINPNHYEALLFQGHISNAMNEYNDAICYYTKAIDYGETNGQLMHMLHCRADIYKVTGDYDKALENYQAILKINPYFSQIYFEIGNAYIQKEEYLKAIENFDEAISQGYDTFEAIFDKAYSLAQLNYFEASNQDYLTLVERGEADWYVYSNMGVNFMELKQYDEAIKYFTKATEINQDYADSFLMLAHIYNLRGQKSKVIENLKKAYEVEPQNLDMYSYQNILALKDLNVKPVNKVLNLSLGEQAEAVLSN